MADCSYFLRSKRRRLHTIKENDDYFFILQPTARRYKNAIMHLPTEVLIVILKQLSYKELAKNVRGVNRRFKTLAEYILNNAFKALEKQLSRIKTEAMFYVNASTDPREARYRCKVLNLIEKLELYYELTVTTIWRYVYIPRSKLCMYAGEILDNYTLFIKRYFKNSRDYSKYYRPVPRLVRIIKYQTKLFCRYFEKVSEMPINSISNSGAKLLDILDVDYYAMKSGHKESFSERTYNLKLTYYFSYCWFAAIESNDVTIQKMGWREHQRYMYMRLRRLVVTHTELQMNEFQYLREHQLMQNSLYFVPRPRSFIYSGYGEEDNNFFFYGVMNQQCYNRRYPQVVRENLEVVRIEAQYEEGSVSSLDSIRPENRLGVQIIVNLKCPIRLAPRKALQKYLKENELHPTFKGNFELELQIISPENSQIRIPEKFCFIVKGKKK